MTVNLVRYWQKSGLVRVRFDKCHCICTHFSSAGWWHVFSLWPHDSKGCMRRLCVCILGGTSDQPTPLLYPYMFNMMHLWGSDWITVYAYVNEMTWKLHFTIYVKNAGTHELIGDTNWWHERYHDNDAPSRCFRYFAVVFMFVIVQHVGKGGALINRATYHSPGTGVSFLILLVHIHSLMALKQCI